MGFPRVRGGRYFADVCAGHCGGLLTRARRETHGAHSAGRGSVFFRLCAEARPCVTAICKERPSEEAKLLLPGAVFLRAPRAGPSLWDGKEGFENRGIAEETACAGCLAVRRRFARRGTWSEPCPMRRRYSPRRGTWSEQAENCRHLDFSFPSRRGGPVLTRARFVRGGLRRRFEMGKLPAVSQGTRPAGAGPSLLGRRGKI